MYVFCSIPLDSFPFVSCAGRMRPFGLSQLLVGDPRELGLNRNNDPDPEAFFGFKRVLNPWVPPFSTVTMALNKLGCGVLCCYFRDFLR